MTEYLEKLAKILPLQLFVLIGGFIEEIVAPIPSFVVMVTAGSMTELNNGSILDIVVLSLITAVGKTLGSIILYFLGDKAEDLVLKRFGKFLGISHQTVENFGSKFEHKTKDIFILSFLRMMPIFPGTPVALACGMIKINFYRYVLATYIGTTLRSIIYGYIGYIGIERYQNILENANTIEAIITILGLVVAGVVFYLMRKKSMEEK